MTALKSSIPKDRKTTLRRRILLISAVLGGGFGMLVVAATLIRFQVAFQIGRTSDAALPVYRLDGVRRLVYSNNLKLLINTEERVVLQMQSGDRRLGPILLFPRDQKGVVLGDGVKGREEDGYRFDDTGVDIHYRAPGSHHLYDLRVPL